MKELINQHDAEGRPHGLWEYYYPDGTLWWRAHWHHGKGHGVWEGYWHDGTLRWREHWHYGEKRGIEKWWNKQGVISVKSYHLVIKWF